MFPDRPDYDFAGEDGEVLAIHVDRAASPTAWWKSR